MMRAHMMRAAFTLLIILAALAGCAKPPPSAQVGAERGEAVAMGKDVAGEECNQQRGGSPDTAYIYCGDWDQPAAHIRNGGPAEPASLQSLATTGPWRTAVDLRLVCDPPQSWTILGGQPALLLRCARRIGGWPQVAIVASVDHTAWLADGILPTLPVMERSIGVLSGRVPLPEAPARPPSPTVSRLIDRLAARAFSAGDVAEYDRLMSLGVRANQAEDFVSAETAYRAALALQQKVLGQKNPNTASALMNVALQLSDQGRQGDADALFDRSARLVPAAADQSAAPRLVHYRALSRINQKEYADALSLLDEAERGYAKLVPPETLTARPRPRLPGVSAGAESIPNERVLTDPVVQSALMGLIEVRRYRAIALRELQQPDEATSAMRSAEDLATANGMVQPLIAARASRTASVIDPTPLINVRPIAGGLSQSAADFRLVLPLTRPVAVTDLLRAGDALKRGERRRALGYCRTGVALLRELKAGADPALLDPCLDILASEAARNPANAQRLFAEMFEVAQTARSSLSSQLIAQAAARLQAGTHNPAVASAIRRRQDAAESLAGLYRQRDLQEQRRPPGTLPYQLAQIDPAELDRQIAKTQGDLADSDAALQEAAPNYPQLVQQVTPARDVLAALHPKEAFAAITITDLRGWTFLLRDGTITVGQSPEAAQDSMNGKVRRLRQSLRIRDGALPPFDTASAEAIYQSTLGTVAPQLEGVADLVVAPSGPLLALPFSMLLTEPGRAADLRNAPWLVRRMTIAHVPSAANFVALRRTAGGSRATQPWFGFGGFHPMTVAQAAAGFPTSACADTARQLANLPPLPFATQELEATRALFGAPVADQVMGASFTAPAVRKANLKNYKILHFATHALMPGEFECLSEPVIITSDPPKATDASGAMLSETDVLRMDLDAESVVLSACNSGGSGGGTGGDGLSALARSFFYAGARSLMATHWPLNDKAAARLVPDTLRRLRMGGDGGLAGSLRAAELSLLDAAGRAPGVPEMVAHPYFWSPFALIGEGSGTPQTAKVAAVTERAVNAPAAREFR